MNKTGFKTGVSKTGVRVNLSFISIDLHSRFLYFRNERGDIEWQSVWVYGWVMRLPRRCAPGPAPRASRVPWVRNDGVIRKGVNDGSWYFLVKQQRCKSKNAYVSYQAIFAVNPHYSTAFLT